MKTTFRVTTALGLSLAFFTPDNGYASSVQIIEHALGGTSYVRGDFRYQQEESTLFAPPYQPAQLPLQCSKIYRGVPQKLLYEQTLEEKLLMNITPGRDGRTKVENPAHWPYLFHSQLSLYFSSGEYGGSGTLVGPHHLLTAAHNVYNHNRDEWVQSIVVRLALDGNIAPFDECQVTRIYTFKNWTRDRNPCYDLALVLLDRPVGHQTGWVGLLALKDKSLKKAKVNVTGYPGDKGFKEMWTMSHHIKQIATEEMSYEIDTYGGQSGSAVWLNKWGSPYLVGVHTLGEGIAGAGNSGVRLSLHKANYILRWIEETLVIEQKLNRRITAARVSLE